MNIILFDDRRLNLLPFTYTRPVADIRIGIRTIREKWEDALKGKASYLTEDYLSAKYGVKFEAENTYINGTVCPDDQLLKALDGLQEGELLYHQEKEKIIAFRSAQQVRFEELEQFEFTQITYEGELLDVNDVWDIFSKNGEAMEWDFEQLTKGRKSAALDHTNRHIGDRLFIEEGAKVQGAILNSTTGPIYVGKNAEIMEGSVVRGGLALCEGAALKLATKIYGPTTVGPYSKVGGEVNNSVLFGYSNKGHDGFLGNSVLGEWCNLGADTNVSNLKNNYAIIKLWNYEKGGFKNTGKQFCGMMMGDHSKSGINTMFNTATVVGVSANIYGGGFPRNFVPSFSWGGSEKWIEYRYPKAMEVAEVVIQRRGIELTEEDRAILQHVYEITKDYRNF